MLATYDFPVDSVREEFPALALRDDRVPRIYLDAPGGTQVPHQVIDAMAEAMAGANANLGGPFRTSVAAGRIVDAAHQAMAEFLGATSAREVVIGPNMTTLTYQISRSLGRYLGRDDEIVVTRMDHEANISPWLQMAEERGANVRWLDFDPESYRFAPDALDAVLGERTRLVALNYASNLIGTVNPVREMAAKARAAGALVYVDAVHYAAHGCLDVQTLDADFIVCSPYKFCGPHLGVLWAQTEILRELFAYHVRTASDQPPERWEPGTPSIEALAGLKAAVDYFVELGEHVPDTPQALPATRGTDRRASIVRAFAAIEAYERALGERLIAGLGEIAGLTIHGIADADQMRDRVPTVAFTIDGVAPRTISEACAAENIFVWDGHNYALEVVRTLGLEDSGGVVRVGPVHYNTAGEIDRFVDMIRTRFG